MSAQEMQEMRRRLEEMNQARSGEPNRDHGVPVDERKRRLASYRLTRGEIESMSERICSICHADFEEGAEVGKLDNCAHLFHKQCILMWLDKSNTCPMCNQPAVNRT